jgi:hypothetical protein
MIKEIDARGKSVLFISDTHCPYHHPDLFPFLKAVKSKLLNKESIIIHGGDETDGHAWSFHDNNVELFSAGNELKLAIENMQTMAEIFPEMHLLESNHGSLLARRIKHHGVPIASLRPLPELYGTPKWQWHHDILLTTKSELKTYICHGKKSGYNALSKEMGCNAIQFHFHGKFEITYAKSAASERYNMFCGCLIDWSSMAFEYGKNHIPKPIIGLGFIDKFGVPHLIKMGLDKNGRWDKKVRKI